MVSNSDAYQLAIIAITDTTTHTYRTDPFDYFSNSGIAILGMGRGKPDIRSYQAFIYNATDQTLTVQLLHNIQSDKTYPDINLGSSTTVSAGEDLALPFNFLNNPVEFISPALSFTTAPTTGKVYVYLFKYY